METKGLTQMVHSAFSAIRQMIGLQPAEARPETSPMPRPASPAVRPPSAPVRRDERDASARTAPPPAAADNGALARHLAATYGDILAALFLDDQGGVRRSISGDTATEILLAYRSNLSPHRLRMLLVGSRMASCPGGEIVLSDMGLEAIRSAVGSKRPNAVPSARALARSFALNHRDLLAALFVAPSTRSIQFSASNEAVIAAIAATRSTLSPQSLRMGLVGLGMATCPSDRIELTGLGVEMVKAATSRETSSASS